MDTRLLGEGREQFDKLMVKGETLSYEGQGTEVKSGEEKNGKKYRLNIIENSKIY